MSPYIIYARKSTESEDRQVLSIEAQIKEVSDYAAKNNIFITKTYIEAKSAKRPGRPVFNEMVKELRRKKGTGILCWKLDRLSRNMLDAALISELLESGFISEIRTPSQIYRNTSNDKFMTGLDWIMAKKYVDDLSENVKRGIKTRISNGWFSGRVPMGYLNYRNPDSGFSNIIIDEKRFPLLRKMWDLMLSGNYSVEKILQIATFEWGFRTRKTRHVDGKPLSRSGLYRIFTDPFYAGQFVFKGELHQGKHPPMVTPEEFDRVQELLGRNGKPRQKKHEFAFTGIIRCGNCGAMITAEEKYKLIKSTGLRKRFAYYRCTRRKDPLCRQPAISEADLKLQVDKVLGNTMIPEEYLDWIFKYLDHVKQNEKEKTAAVDDSAQKEIGNLQRRFDNLLSLKISPDNADGQLLSDAEYLSQKNRLTKMKLLLEAKNSKSKNLAEEELEITRGTFNFAAYARAWFAKGTLERQREILSSIGLNHMLIDKKLLIQLKKPLAVIEKHQNPSSFEFKRFEPLKFRQNNEKSRRFSPTFLVTSGLVDKVRTEIRRILRNPQSHPEEMNFFAFLKHLNDSMSDNSVKGEKVADENNCSG
jgi:site-specific DNA recombinase